MNEMYCSFATSSCSLKISKSNSCPHYTTQGLMNLPCECQCARDKDLQVEWHSQPLAWESPESHILFAGTLGSSSAVREYQVVVQRMLSSSPHSSPCVYWGCLAWGSSDSLSHLHLHFWQGMLILALGGLQLATSSVTGVFMLETWSWSLFCLPRVSGPDGDKLVELEISNFRWSVGCKLCCGTIRTGFVLVPVSSAVPDHSDSLHDCAAAIEYLSHSII